MGVEKHPFLLYNKNKKKKKDKVIIMTGREKEILLKASDILFSLSCRTGLHSGVHDLLF